MHVLKHKAHIPFSFFCVLKYTRRAKSALLMVYLNVQEVTLVERDRAPVHWGVVIQGAIVRDIGAYCKRHRLRLETWRGR